MNLTTKQIEAVKAGQPVAIETEEAGRLYLVSEELFQQVIILLQSEPEQEAFRKFSMQQLAESMTETTEARTPTLADQFADVIGTAPDLPSDMAVQHDHYLHGSPRS